MNKIRLSALVMCFAILMSMLTSCRLPGSNGNNVVKADDPWYESTRFKIEKNLRQNDRVQSELICTSDDVFYSIYCSTDDMYASTRTMLDTYDYDGKLVNRKE